MDRKPDIRDRKALRAAALDLHRMATDMKERRGGIIPSDDPTGYVDRFALRLRDMASGCETMSKGHTVSQAKRELMAAAVPTPETDEAGVKAMRNAVNAMLGRINLQAQRLGVDPYEGMIGRGEA